MSMRKLEIMVERGPKFAGVLDCLLQSLDPKHHKFITVQKLEEAHPPTNKVAVILYPLQVTVVLQKLALLQIEGVPNGRGCGVEFGVCSVSDVAVTKPSPPKPHAKGRRTIRAWMGKRMSVEEIRSAIIGGTNITFNFITMLVAGSIISAVGLATDSAIMVVASMLISPLMGPILAFTFGAAAGDRQMMWKGFRNELISCAIVLVCGLVLGVLFAPFGKEYRFPTNEMAGRGTISNIKMGLFFAVASGLVAGVSVTGGGINALVGVAISASLLPPVVNSGMMISYAYMGPWLFNVAEDATMIDTANATAAAYASRHCSLPTMLQECGIGAMSESYIYEYNVFPYSVQLAQAGDATAVARLLQEIAGRWVYSVDSKATLYIAQNSFLLYLMNVVVIFIITCGVFMAKNIFKVADAADSSHHAIITMRNQVRLDKNLAKLHSVRKKIKLETTVRRLSTSKGDGARPRGSLSRRKTMALLKQERELQKRSMSLLNAMDGAMKLKRQSAGADRSAMIVDEGDESADEGSNKAQAVASANVEVEVELGDAQA